MSSKKETSEKRFQVFNGTDKVHESQTRSSADKKVVTLQKENARLIVLKDTKNQKETTYSKLPHEKNYRVR